MRRGRITTGVLLWLVAAAAATAVGMTAVAAIGTDLFGDSGTPLSSSEVDDQLASRSPSATAPPTTSSTPPTSSSSTPPPPGPERSVPTEGGTVIARCEAGGVRVVQAVPALGFRVDSDDDEVDDHPSVKFRSGDREIEVRFRCVNGVPQPEVEND